MKNVKIFPIALIMCANSADADTTARGSPEEINCCDASGRCEYVASFGECSSLLAREGRIVKAVDDDEDDESDGLEQIGECATGARLNFSARGGRVVLVESCDIAAPLADESDSPTSGIDPTVFSCLVRQVECGAASSDADQVEWPLFEEQTLSLESWLAAPAEGEIFWLLEQQNRVFAAQRTEVPQCE